MIIIYILVIVLIISAIRYLNNKDAYISEIRKKNNMQNNMKFPVNNNIYRDVRTGEYKKGPPR